MKILVISPFDPRPSNTGALVRIKNIVEGLSRFHHVDLIYPNDTPRGLKNKFRTLQSLFSAYPYHVNFYYSKNLKADLSERIQHSYDLLYLNFIYPLVYLPEKLTIPVILDQHNVDREYWKNKKIVYAENLIKRKLSEVNLRKTIAFENHYLPGVFGYVSVSEQDRERTMEYAIEGIRHFLVAPNGVNVNQFRRERKLHNSGAPLVIGFLGSFDLDINREAARRIICDIYPALKQKHPAKKIEIVLIGRNPPKPLMRLAEHDKTIRFTGTVDHVWEHLSEIDIFLAPLIGGGGTKLRLFEAMSMGLPVLGTPDLFMGVDGIKTNINAEIGVTDEEIIGKLACLVDDPQQRDRLGQSARDLVVGKYSWEIITKNLSDDLISIVK